MAPSKRPESPEGATRLETRLALIENCAAAMARTHQLMERSRLVLLDADARLWRAHSGGQRWDAAMTAALPRERRSW